MAAWVDLAQLADPTLLVATIARALGLPVAQDGEQLPGLDGRDAPAHQQTLLAALDWSHGLLSAAEQTLFRRLGVFVGGFSLDLAIALARCEGIDEWTLIERLNGRFGRRPVPPRTSCAGARPQSTRRSWRQSRPNRRCATG